MADPGPVPSVINTYTMIFTLLIDKCISVILGHASPTLYFAHRALHYQFGQRLSFCIKKKKKKVIPWKMVFHMTGEIYRQTIFYYILSRTVAVKKFRNSGNINPEISSNMWNVARFRNNQIMSDFGGKISSV